MQQLTTEDLAREVILKHPRLALGAYKIKIAIFNQNVANLFSQRAQKIVINDMDKLCQEFHLAGFFSNTKKEFGELIEAIAEQLLKY